MSGVTAPFKFVLPAPTASPAVIVVGAEEAHHTGSAGQKPFNPVIAGLCCVGLCCCCSCMLIICLLVGWTAVCSDLTDRDPAVGLAQYSYPVHGAVLFAGDSFIDYWDGSALLDQPCTDCRATPSRWKEVAADMGGTAYNVGVAVTTVAQWERRADILMHTYQPDVIVLSCGRYDLSLGEGCGTLPLQTYGSPSVKVVETLESLVNKLLKNNTYGKRPRIFYFGVFREPVSSLKHDALKEYNDMVKAMAVKISKTADPPPFVMIDTLDGFMNSGCRGACFSQDGQHLTPLAYDNWRAWLTRAATATGRNSSCLIWKDGACDEYGAYVAP
eukprot:TRINITY_DN23576_c0_g1_i1.p1 TRINITY_DN23576_c0_g1~~TRINITY_DN23576_c0_g1_i1.p1  ORF type:complete len:329 (+),score=29.73 TRINITY_DN23576_c0_g1_i1:118-1104(+)